VQLFHCEPRPRPKHRALFHRGNRWFDGWTGFQFFGCLTPHRYFGWQLHCWADVYVKAFGDIRQAIFFARLEDAIPVIGRLMDFADKLGQLSHTPVEYWPPDDVDWKAKLPIENLARFEWISPLLVSDPHVPHDSPAHWQRLSKRFPADGPLNKKQKQFHAWRASAPKPELYL
jgi:hypothetical protein